MRECDLPRIHQYVGGVIKTNGGIPMQIGGMLDHIHILSTLPKDTTIPDFVRKVKSESSRWIKNLDPYYHTFCWQEGYGAFSVSASVVPNLVKYIAGQAQHHRTKSFRDEYIEFLNAYEIEFDEKYLL